MEVRFSDNRRVFDFLESRCRKHCTTGEMIRRLYWMTTKDGKKAVRRHLSKLPSVSHKSSFPPAFRLDIASRSVRMSRQQHRCRIRQSSDRPIWSTYTKSRPVRSTTTSSQSVENSINKPTIRALTDKVNMLDTAMEGLSTQRTEEESVASDSLSKATADPVSSTGAGIGTSENVGVSPQRQHHSAILPPQPFEKKRFRTGCP